MKTQRNKRSYFIPSGLYSYTLDVPGVQTVNFKKAIDYILMMAKKPFPIESSEVQHVLNCFRNLACLFLCKIKNNGKFSWGRLLEIKFGRTLGIVKDHLEEVYAEYENRFNFVGYVGGYAVQLTKGVIVPININSIDVSRAVEEFAASCIDISDLIQDKNTFELCKFSIEQSISRCKEVGIDIMKDESIRERFAKYEVEVNVDDNGYRFKFKSGPVITIGK